jgi:hypothetical protein
MRVVTIARKPIVGSVAVCCIEHGTGGINVDGCRIRTDGEQFAVPQSDPGKRRGTVGTDLGITRKDIEGFQEAQRASIERTQLLGRWPANLILQHQPSCKQVEKQPEECVTWECADGCPVAELDRQSGGLHARGNVGPSSRNAYNATSYSTPTGGDCGGAADYGDSGGASRFFKQVKP